MTKQFYILELNTQPGMTPTSLVPEIANYKGINFDNLIDWILLDATQNKNNKYCFPVLDSYFSCYNYNGFKLSKLSK